MPIAVLSLILAALFGVVFQVLFFRHGPGVNIVLAVALFLAAAWWLHPREARPEQRDLWIPAAAVFFAGWCAVRAEWALVTVNVLAALALSVASVSIFGGVRLARLPLAGLLGEATRAAGSLALRGATVVGAAWPFLTSAMGTRASRAGGYVAGLLLAVPFLAIFASLFGSADAVFARAMSELFDLRRWLDGLGDVPGRTVIGVVAAWLAAGAFAYLRAGGRAAAPGAQRGWLAIEPASVALLSIVTLFAAFVGLQLTYLFGGRDTLEAAGVTYSAYARRGFFELTAVASLVAVLLFCTELAVRRRTRSYVAAALALLILTAVVLVSAAYRLDLYQRAYGWTEQRLYALALIAFLAGALAILGWSVACGRTRWAAQPVAMAALAVAAVVNALAPGDFVVRANIARVLDPGALPADAEARLDVWYLAGLEGGLPALVESLPSLPEPERGRLGTLLLYQFDWRSRVPQSWQSWNLDRERAGRALVDAREALRNYPAQ